MTTLAFGGRGRARDLVTGGLFALWLATVVATWFGMVEVAGVLRFLLVFAVPLVLVVAAVLKQRETPHLALVAGAAAAVPVALAIAWMLHLKPTYAAAAPGIVIGALATHRFPTATVGGIFFISGTYGSLEAFTPLPTAQLLALLLAGLWAGILGRLIVGRRDLPLRPTPALFLLVAYLIITIAGIFTAPAVGPAIGAFRMGPFLLTAVLLVGYGTFREETLRRLPQLMLAVCFGVAAYAVLRWITGPAAAEAALQRTDFARQYNVVAETGETKVQGSFPNGRLLGNWMANALPFVLAMALGTRGHWRLLALATLPLGAIALLASGNRASTAAVAGGSLLVILLHMLSRGFRGPRLGVALAAFMTILAIATVAYPVVLDTPEDRARFGNILSPTQDVPFQERLIKWRKVATELDGHPFGYGLGSGSPLALPQRFSTVATIGIDNGYLTIAFEQGFAVMALFILAMLVILVELIRHAVWSRAPQESVLCAAAAGTLFTLLVNAATADNFNTVPIVAGWLIIGLGIAQYGSRRPAVDT